MHSVSGCKFAVVATRPAGKPLPLMDARREQHFSMDVLNHTKFDAKLRASSHSKPSESGSRLQKRKRLFSLIRDSNFQQIVCRADSSVGTSSRFAHDGPG